MKKFAKILVLLLAVALVCGLLFTITASAGEDIEWTEVTSEAELNAVFDKADGSTQYIKVMNDITFTGVDRGDGKYHNNSNMTVYIDLNGKTLSASNYVLKTNSFSDWKALFACYNRVNHVTLQGTGKIELDGTALYRGHYELNQGTEAQAAKMEANFGFSLLGSDKQNPIVVEVKNVDGNGVVYMNDGNFEMENTVVKMADTGGKAFFKSDAKLGHPVNVEIKDSEIYLGTWDGADGFSGNFTPNNNSSAKMFNISGISVTETNAAYGSAAVSIRAIDSVFKGSICIGGTNVAAYGKDEPTQKYESVEWYFERCTVEYGTHAEKVGSATARFYPCDGTTLTIKDCDWTAYVQDFINVSGCKEKDYKIVIDGGYVKAVAAWANTDVWAAGNSLLSSYNGGEWNKQVKYDATTDKGLLVTGGTHLVVGYEYDKNGDGKWKVVDISKWTNCGIASDEVYFSPVKEGDWYVMADGRYKVKTAEELATAMADVAKNGGWIVLDADIDFTASQLYATGMQYTFELNGHTLTYKNSASTDNALFQTNGGNGLITVLGPGTIIANSRLSQPYGGIGVRFNDADHNTADTRIKVQWNASQIAMFSGGEFSVYNTEIEIGSAFASASSNVISTYLQTHGGKGVVVFNNVNIHGNTGAGKYLFNISPKKASFPDGVHPDQYDMDVTVINSSTDTRLWGLGGEVSNIGLKFYAEGSTFKFPNDGVNEAMPCPTGLKDITFAAGNRFEINCKIDSARLPGWNCNVKMADGACMWVVEAPGKPGGGDDIIHCVWETRDNTTGAIAHFNEKNSNRDCYFSDPALIETYVLTCAAFKQPVITADADFSFAATKQLYHRTQGFSIDLNGHNVTIGQQGSGTYAFQSDSGRDVHILDSKGTGCLIIDATYFGQANGSTFYIDGTAEHPVHINHRKSGGYLWDVYSGGGEGSHATVNYAIIESAASFLFSNNLTVAKTSNITIKNSTINLTNASRVIHQEEARNGEDRFYWKGNSNIVIENSTINAPKAQVVHHLCAFAPVTMTIKDSDITAKILVSYEGTDANMKIIDENGAKNTGRAIGEWKPLGDLKVTMTGGKLSTSERGLNIPYDIKLNMLFEEVEMTVSGYFFTSDNRSGKLPSDDSTFVLKNCDINYIGNGGRMSNVQLKNWFTIDGGSFRSESDEKGWNALNWLSVVTIGTHIDSLVYFNHPSNMANGGTDGIRFSGIAPAVIPCEDGGYDIVAPDDERIVGFAASITRTTAHGEILYFNSVSEAIAFARGKDVVVCIPDDDNFVNFGAPVVAPAYNVTLNLGGGFLVGEDDSAAMITVNADNANLTINLEDGIVISAGAFLNVTAGTVVVDGGTEGALTYVAEGFITNDGGNVTLKNLSVDTDDEAIAIEFLLIGEIALENVSVNGEAQVPAFVVMAGDEVVTSGKTGAELVAAIGSLTDGQILVLNKDMELVAEDYGDKQASRLTGAGSLKIDLGGNTLTATGANSYAEGFLFCIYIYGTQPASLEVVNGNIVLSGCGLMKAWCDDEDKVGNLHFDMNGVNVTAENSDKHVIATRCYDMSFTDVAFTTDGVPGIIRTENGKAFPAMNVVTLANVDVVAVNTPAAISVSSTTPIDMTIDAESSFDLDGRFVEVVSRSGKYFAAFVNLVVDGASVKSTSGDAIIYTEAGMGKSSFILNGAMIDAAVLSELNNGDVITGGLKLMANLTLRSNVAYNVKVPAEYLDVITAVSINVNGVEYPVDVAEIMTLCNMNPVTIGDRIALSVSYLGKTYSWDLSVLDFAQMMIDSESVEPAEKTAIVSMVAFAKAVAGDNASDALAAFDTTDAKVDAIVAEAGTLDGYTASLVFGEMAGLRIESSAEAEVELWIGDELFGAHNFADDAVAILNLSAAQLNSVISVKVEGVEVGTISIGNLADAELAAAIANYAEAVAAMN